MALTNQDALKKRQEAAQVVHDKMLNALMGFTPAEALKVSDVKFIADYAQTLAFEAIEETNT